MQPHAETAPPAHAPMGFYEFVALIAALMALNALAIDIMLPALPDMGQLPGAVHANDRQVVMGIYMWGFGIGQLLVGTVSDRFGRKPVLMLGIATYVITSLICAFAPTFGLLLAARFAQGIACAVPRVITTSVARDCYQGRRMAGVMSLVMTVFMSVPVLAPTIGQGILLVAPWRWIFGLLAAYGLAIGIWSWLRLPETLPVDRRRPMDLRSIAQSFRAVVGQRATLGYAVAGGLMFGAIFSFLVSAQQVLGEMYGLGPYFTLAFSGIAVTMSASSFLNSRLVGRMGMRRISQAAVMLFTLVAIMMGVAARAGQLNLASALAGLGCIMFLVGLVFPNFNALAMEPQGKQAGTASSFIGSFTTIIASTIGYAVGQAFDGTIVPLTTAHAMLGLACLFTIFVTERYRFFKH